MCKCLFFLLFYVEFAWPTPPKKANTHGGRIRRYNKFFDETFSIPAIALRIDTRAVQP